MLSVNASVGISCGAVSVPFGASLSDVVALVAASPSTFPAATVHSPPPQQEGPTVVSAVVGGHKGALAICAQRLRDVVVFLSPAFPHRLNGVSLAASTPEACFRVLGPAPAPTDANGFRSYSFPGIAVVIPTAGTPAADAPPASSRAAHLVLHADPRTPEPPAAALSETALTLGPRSLPLAPPPTLQALVALLGAPQLEVPTRDGMLIVAWQALGLHAAVGPAGRVQALVGHTNAPGPGFASTGAARVALPAQPSTEPRLRTPAEAGPVTEFALAGGMVVQLAGGDVQAAAVVLADK
jgi:hypothetical protein